MSDGIVWIHWWLPKDAWYYATPRDRRAALARWEQVWDEAIRAGARRLTTGSTRSSSAWARVSVWEFPSVAVLATMTAQLEEAGYTEFIEMDNTVAVTTDEPFAPYMAAARATTDNQEAGHATGN